METNNNTVSRRQGRLAHPQALAYGVDEAAHILSVSRRTLYELISEDKLKSAKIRGRRLITRASLEQLLAESQ
jgi:excisionase family DNA binding protein